MRDKMVGRKSVLLLLLAGGIGLLACLPVLASAGRTGEALVVAQTGHASARIFTGPVHEGRTEVKPLFEGASLGESSRVMTGKDGHLCMVLSPGAILCVAPKTELTLRELRHTADGLPSSEEDLIRRMEVDLHKGRIRIHAGTPIPTTEILIRTPDGSIEAHGGDFVVAQDSRKNWNLFTEGDEAVMIPLGGDRITLGPDRAARFERDAEGQVVLQTENVPRDESLDGFELCNTFFTDLEPFIHHTREFNRGGLESYIGLNTPFVRLDDNGMVTDVSPSERPDAQQLTTSPLPVNGMETDRGRWDEQRIWTWFEQVGTVKGVNYIPRTAVNSVEMWMEDSFDPDVIDEELGWAQDVGYTCIRVQLQFEVWKADPDGFLDRVDRLLDIARRNGLRVTLVLFDDLNLAGQPPRTGKQPDPLPGVYNGRWVPSPAARDVTDRSRWPELEEYVRDVMKKFSSDSRVLYWDLYNTAGNNGLREDSLPLMDQTFNWARSVKPSQPLAVAPWREFSSAMAARELERSDLVTFQSFDNVESIEARLLMLQKYERPIICSDWLMRQVGNDFEQVLPLFSVYQVGWFNQGLVAGRTQKMIQQKQFRSEQDPDVWQQDVLHDDGSPYSRREVELIQGFHYLDAP